MEVCILSADKLAYNHFVWAAYFNVNECHRFDLKLNYFSGIVVSIICAFIFTFMSNDKYNLKTVLIIQWFCSFLFVNVFPGLQPCTFPRSKLPSGGGSIQRRPSPSVLQYRAPPEDGASLQPNITTTTIWVVHVWTTFSQRFIASALPGKLDIDVDSFWANLIYNWYVTYYCTYSFFCFFNHYIIWPE